MKEIMHGTEILARYISADSWKDGLSFFSKDEEFIQLGTWKYNKGKDLLAHIHNVVNRKINRTQEVVFVVNGSIEAKIFSLDGILRETLVVGKADCLVLLNCGHGYKILEDDTQVLEVKNGPYFGAEIDRKRI
jgi:hypothetical protein